MRALAGEQAFDAGNYTPGSPQNISIHFDCIRRC